MFRRIGAILGLLTLLWLAGAVNGAAQQAERHFFAETGHWMEGDFWAWYQANPAGARVLGAPITEAFQDPQSGWWVQYFFGGRLEQRVQADGSPRIMMTPLGAYYHTVHPGIPLNVTVPDAACMIFAEVPHRVCLDFLTGFQAYGGLAGLGYPVSEIEYQEGMLVQYFERGRLEWHPDRPPGQRVLVTDLGLRYFRDLGLDTRLLLPKPSGDTPYQITHLTVRASVARPVVMQNSLQTLYVVVQDQIRQPVVNAQVSFRLIASDGALYEYRLLPTDEHGIARYTFSLAGLPRGLTQIVVVVDYSGLRSTGRTSFRIWW